jgi:hypothetical protein
MHSKYQLPHNVPCPGGDKSCADNACAAVWASNSVGHRIKQWNFAAETASWISENISKLGNDGVKWVYSKCVPFPTGNTQHLGCFVQVTCGTESGNIYYVDHCGNAHLIEKVKSCCPKDGKVCTWATSEDIPIEDPSSSNKCQFVQVTEGIGCNNIYFVDGTGIPHLIEHGQRGGDWWRGGQPDDSNNTSNLGDFFEVTEGPNAGDVYFVDNNGTSHVIARNNAIDFSCNTAVWTSNNLANYPTCKWLLRGKAPPAQGNPKDVRGCFVEVNGDGNDNGNIYFVDMDGAAHLVDRTHKWVLEMRRPASAGNDPNNFIEVRAGLERSNVYWVDNNGYPHIISKPVAWDWASNTAGISLEKAMWASNGVPTWMIGGRVPMNDGNTTDLGKFIQVTNGDKSGSVFFNDVNGVSRLIYDPNGVIWCSNNFSNYPTCHWVTVDGGSTPNIEPGARNTTNLGKFVEIGSGDRVGDKYFVDMKGAARLIEEPKTLRWASNTTNWCSNELGKRPKVEWVKSTVVPDNENNSDNLGKFVEIIGSGPNLGERYYVDLKGEARMLESPCNLERMQLKLNWTSNSLSNYAFSNGMSNWNWASNTAMEVKTILYMNRSNWDWASNTAQWGSNKVVWASNTAQWASNTAQWGSNTAQWGSNTAQWGSNKANWASNTAQWASNTAQWGSNKANWASNTAQWASNTAQWGSNKANWASNTAQWGSNKANWASNTAQWGSNKASWASNTAQWGSNKANWASNTAQWASNFVPEWKNVTTIPKPPYTANEKGSFIYETSTSNKWFVDYNGRGEIIEDAQKQFWASNNIPEWLEKTTNTIDTTDRSKFVKLQNGNSWFVDYTGKSNCIEDKAKIEWASNTAQWGSNKAIWASNTAQWGSNKAFWASNTAQWGSNKAFWASNTARWGCNTAVWASNNIPKWKTIGETAPNINRDKGSFVKDKNGTLYYVDNTGTNNVIEDPVKLKFASNTAVTANTTANTALVKATFACNAIPQIITVTNVDTTKRNMFQQDGKGNVWYVDADGTKVQIESPDVPYVEKDYWVYPANQNYTYTQCNVTIGATTDPTTTLIPWDIEAKGEDHNPKVTVKGGDIWIFNGRLHVRKDNAWNQIFVYNNLAYKTPANKDVYKCSAEICCARPNMTGTFGCDDNDYYNGPGVRYVYLQCQNQDCITIDNRRNVCVGWNFDRIPEGDGPYDRTLATQGGAFIAMGQAYRKNNNANWDQPSDLRTKENITTANIDLCYKNMKSLPLQHFRYKEKYFKGNIDRHVLGWIAQDVQKVIPKAVSVGKNEYFDDFLMLNVSQIYTMMYGAVSKIIEKVEEHDLLANQVTECQIKCNTLETKCAKLEEDNNTLKAKVAVLETFMQTMLASMASRQ